MADVEEEIRPVCGSNLAHALGQSTVRLRPEGRTPERQTIPYQDPGDRLLLHLGNMCQHLPTPCHLVRHTALEVEYGRALCLQGRLCRRNAAQRGIDLLEDQLRRLR